MGMIIVVWLISTQPMVSHSAETEKQANRSIAKVVKKITSVVEILLSCSLMILFFWALVKPTNSLDARIMIAMKQAGKDPLNPEPKRTR